CGISDPFGPVFPTAGWIAHAFLSRLPLPAPKGGPFDLHVLCTPPAFILSQDQTLQQVGSRSGSATTSRRSFSSAVIFDPAASVRLRLAPVILARCDPAAGLHPRPDRRIDEPPERLLLTTIQLLRFSL